MAQLLDRRVTLSRTDACGITRELRQEGELARPAG
jgi:hypothetical protein